MSQEGQRRWIEIGLFLMRPGPMALMVLALASAAAAAIARSPVGDPDVWWVAAAGREMLLTGSVPRHNLFSFTEPDHAWLMHEWLLGPLYAVGIARFGPEFLTGVALACLGGALYMVLTGTLGTMRNSSAALTLCLLFMACFAARWTSARPSGVALLLPLLLTPIAFASRFRIRHALSVVLLEALWTNVHGSFPLGILLIGASAAERTTDRALRVATTAAAAVVTLLNPYGIELHRLVLSYLAGTRGIFKMIHRDIHEFRNVFGTWGTTVGFIEIFGLAVVSGFAIAAVRHPVWRLRGILSLLLVALGLHQARHVELAGIVSCLLLAPVVDRCARRLPPRLRGLGRHGLPAGPLALVAVPWVVGSLLFVTRPRPTEPGSWLAAGPQFLEALGHVPNGARLYVPFSQAGTAIWYAFPRGVRVFLDSRNDCYSAETFGIFRELRSRRIPGERALRILSDHGVTDVLVPEDHVLATKLPLTHQWRLSARSKDWLHLTNVSALE